MTLASAVWESLQPPHSQELVRNLEYQAQILDRLRKEEDATFVRTRISAVVHAAKWAEAS